MTEAIKNFKGDILNCAGSCARKSIGILKDRSPLLRINKNMILKLESRDRVSAPFSVLRVLPCILRGCPDVFRDVVTKKMKKKDRRMEERMMKGKEKRTEKREGEEGRKEGRVNRGNWGVMRAEPRVERTEMESTLDLPVARSSPVRPTDLLSGASFS